MPTAIAESHPCWCAGTEQPGEDHTSITVHAAAPTDGTDIRLRLQELSVDDIKIVPLLFLDFVEDEERDERYFCPLLLPQAKLLADALNTLLTNYQKAQDQTDPSLCDSSSHRTEQHVQRVPALA